MLSANEIAEVNQAQRTYARLAGTLMLGAIVIAICGGASSPTSRVTETLQRRRPGLQHRNVYTDWRSRAF